MEHTMVDNNLSAYELARLQRIDENKEYVSSLLSFFFLTKRIYICRSLDINIFVILYIYNEYIVQHLTSDFFFISLPRKMNQVREEMQQARDSLRQTSTPEANPKKKRRKASRKRGSPPTRKSTRATNQVQSYADQFDSNEELDSSDNDEDYSDSDSDSDSDEETTNKRKANNQFSLKKEKKKSKTNYPPTSRQMSTAANKLKCDCLFFYCSCKKKQEITEEVKARYKNMELNNGPKSITEAKEMQVLARYFCSFSSLSISHIKSHYL